MRLPVRSWKNTLTKLNRASTMPRRKSRLCTRLESLEPRVVLTASPESALLTAALAEVGAATNYELAANEAHASFQHDGNIFFESLGTAARKMEPGPLQPQVRSSVVFTGRDNVNDTLSLDFGTLPRKTDGSLAVETIVYHGGTAGYDTLKLSGGTFKRISYTPTGRDSGILTYELHALESAGSEVAGEAPSGQSAAGDAALLTVIFTGLEPIEETNYADELVIGNKPEAETIYIVDGNPVNGDDTLRVYEANANFEEITFANAEYVEVHGGDGDDVIHVNFTVPSTGLVNLFVYGDEGNDELYGSAGDDILFGNDGDDLLFGNAGNDSLLGGDGNDTLEGGTGYDVLDGLDGDDTYVFNSNAVDLGTKEIGDYANADHDTLDFRGFGDAIVLDLTDGSFQVLSANLTIALADESAIENVLAGSGGSTITGNSRDNRLIGGDGADILQGNAGEDALEGQGGDDILVGGDGDDTYLFDRSVITNLGSDLVFEIADEGIDTLDFSDFDVAVLVNLAKTTEQAVSGSNLFLTLSDGDAVENLIGSNFADTITGNSLDNTLIGNDGNDILNGSGGDDTLSGGNGDDTLNGGDGTDSLDGGSGNNTLNSGDSDPAPQFVGTSAFNVNEDAETTAINLFADFSSSTTPDSDLLFEITAESGDGLLSAIQLDPAAGTLSVSYVPDAYGTGSVTVSVTDNNGQSISQSYYFYVSSVNDLPVTSGLEDITVTQGWTDITVLLGQAFYDVELGTNLSFDYELDGNDDIVSNVSTSGGEFVVWLDMLESGSVDITVIAHDGYTTVEATFALTVNPIEEGPSNRPPELYGPQFNAINGTFQSTYGDMYVDLDQVSAYSVTANLEGPWWLDEGDDSYGRQLYGEHVPYSTVYVENFSDDHGLTWSGGYGPFWYGQTVSGSYTGLTEEEFKFWYANGQEDESEPEWEDIYVYNYGGNDLDVNGTIIHPSEHFYLDSIEFAGYGDKSGYNGGTQITITPQDPVISFIVSGYDPDYDSLTFDLIESPEGAGLTQAGSDHAEVTWTLSDSTEAGFYEFTVRVSDDGDPSMFDEETYLVIVRRSRPEDEHGDNWRPVAHDDEYSLAAGTRTTGNLLGNDYDADSDTLEIASHSNPATGRLTLNANGTFSYVAAADYVGEVTFSYTATDGTQASNTATVTFTVGEPSYQSAQLESTNMMAVDLDLEYLLQNLSLPQDFDTESANFTIQDTLGGTIADGQYIPNHTYDANPWNPDYPLGGLDHNGQPVAGGASFVGYFQDAEGLAVFVKVLIYDSHAGYEFVRIGNAVDKQPAGAGGGLLLVGGGGESTLGDAFRWFLDQARGGDVVVIGNESGGNDFEGQADEFYRKYGKPVDSVTVFYFDTNTTTNKATANAKLAARDTGAGDANGQGAGRAFLDAIHGAEAIWFMGGDQFPYWELLHNTVAATKITGQNNDDKTVVGGTSAGLAILGQYVFSAEYIRGSNEELLSGEILNNFYTTDFVRNNHASIEQDMFGFTPLQGVLTETHFVDAGLDSTKYYRLGRHLSFLGAVDLGMAQLAANRLVRGLGVDRSTALTISSDGTTAKAYGRRNVWFTWLPTSPVNRYPNIGPARIDSLTTRVRPLASGQTITLATAWSGGVEVRIVDGRLPNTLPKLPFPPQNP